MLLVTQGWRADVGQRAVLVGLASRLHEIDHNHLIQCLQYHELLVRLSLRFVVIDRCDHQPRFPEGQGK